MQSFIAYVLDHVELSLVKEEANDWECQKQSREYICICNVDCCSFTAIIVRVLQCEVAAKAEIETCLHNSPQNSIPEQFLFKFGANLIH